MTHTRTIAGTTYYQDPADADLWYDAAAKVGRQGLAWATFELDDHRQLVAEEAQTLLELLAEGNAAGAIESASELRDYITTAVILTALAR